MDRRRILKLTSIALAGSPALPTVAGGFAGLAAICPPDGRTAHARARSPKPRCPTMKNGW